MAETAEESGFYSLLVPTRFSNGLFAEDQPLAETWTTATALAAVTKRIRCLVAVRPGFISLGLFAQMSSALPKSPSTSRPRNSGFSPTIASQVFDQIWYCRRHDFLWRVDGSAGKEGRGGNGKRGTTSRCLSPPIPGAVTLSDEDLSGPHPASIEGKLPPHDLPILLRLPQSPAQGARHQQEADRH